MIAKPFDDLNGLLSERSVGNGAAKREFDMAALLAEETKYRLLVEHIPAITYIAAIDEQSSTHYTSPQIEAILGFSQAEWKVSHTLAQADPRSGIQSCIALYCAAPACKVIRGNADWY